MNLGSRKFGHSSVRLTHFRPESADKEELAVLAEKVRFVSHVETDAGHERKGHATTMMRKVCREADSAGLTLVLGVVPYGDMGLLDLQCWYTKLGFVHMQDEPLLMMRIARQ